MELFQTDIGAKAFGNRGAYYFSRLRDDQKKIYASLQSGIRNYVKSIKLPMRPASELSLIYRAVLADNPLFFYTAAFRWQTDLCKQRNIVFPDYEYSRADRNAYTAAIYDHLRIYDAVKGKSDREKEQFVHDYCLEHFTYGDGGSISHTALGLILHKTAVCEGIAKYVKVVLDYLGVGCLVVSGKAQTSFCCDKTEECARNSASCRDATGNHAWDSVSRRDKTEDHAWNIVKVDGKTYHLDVTFDMIVKNRLPRYDYFNLCDDDIRKDHSIVSDVPECATAGRDYYSLNAMAVHGKNGLENYIAHRVKNGEQVIVVKLIGAEQAKDICNKVMQAAGQAYTKVKGAGVSVEMNYNPSQMVFEINFR